MLFVEGNLSDPGYSLSLRTSEGLTRSIIGKESKL